jgi:N-acetylneuraminic acid mutarotase
MLKLKELNHGPLNVQGHSCVEYKSKIYLFGGRIPTIQKEKRTYSNSIFIYSPKEDSWEKLDLKIQPKPVHNHTCTVYQNSFFIFGGSGYKGFNKNFWEFNFETNEWKEVKSENIPPLRHSHTSNLYKNSMITFGGHFTDFSVKPSKRTFFNDVHAYNLENQSWNELKTNGDVPEGRSWHSSSLVNDSLFIFGGFFMKKKQESYFNDLSILNMNTLTWSKTIIHSISPRNRHSSTVLNSNQILICGGNYLNKNGIDVFLGDSFVISFDDEQSKIKCESNSKLENGLKISNHTSTFCDGSLYFYGGEVGRDLKNNHYKVEFHQ